MKGESFTFLTSSGEDVWKAMGIVEVMEKTNQAVPPQVQVKNTVLSFILTCDAQHPNPSKTIFTRI